MRRPAFFLIIVILLAAPTHLRAQVDQQLFLPAQDDVVMMAWTDSAPELIAELSKADLNPLRWIQKELEQEGLDHELVPLREIVDALTVAVEEEMFSDDLVFIMREREDGKWGWSITASTKFDQKQCEAFFEQLGTLLTTGQIHRSKWAPPIVGGPIILFRDPDQPHARESKFRYPWQLDGNTISIASGFTELEHLTTTKFEEKTSLIERREFQTILAKTRNAASDSQSETNVGFFVSPRAIEALLWKLSFRNHRRFTKEKRILGQAIQDADCRGIGGFVGTHHDPETSPVIAMNAIAICSQPLKGIFDSLQNRALKDALQIDFPIRTVLQVNIDPASFKSELDTSVERFVTNNESVQRLTASGFANFKQWFRDAAWDSFIDEAFFSKVDSIGYVQPYRVSSRGHLAGWIPNRMLHFQDSTQVVNDVEEIIKSQIENKFSRERMPVELERSSDDGQFTWTLSEASIAERIRVTEDYYLDRIAIVRQRLEAGEKGLVSSSSKNFDIKKFIEQQKAEIAEYEESLRQFGTMAEIDYSKPYRMANGWLFFDSFDTLPERTTESEILESKSFLEKLDQFESEAHDSEPAAIRFAQQHQSNRLIYRHDNWLEDVILTKFSRSAKLFMVTATKDNVGFVIKARIDQRDLSEDKPNEK